jgi:hypothetical protein
MSTATKTKPSTRELMAFARSAAQGTDTRRKLQEELHKLGMRRKAEQQNTEESSSRGGATRPNHQYNGRQYIVHTGSRGGKYIIVNKEKKYI